MNASAPNNSEQHPVFSSLPQLQAHHPKVEKVKQMKVATEKKPTAKQKKQQQMHEQKSKADQDMFSIHSTGPLSKWVQLSHCGKQWQITYFGSEVHRKIEKLLRL